MSQGLPGGFPNLQRLQALAGSPPTMSGAQVPPFAGRPPQLSGMFTPPPAGQAARMFPTYMPTWRPSGPPPIPASGIPSFGLRAGTMQMPTLNPARPILNAPIQTQAGVMPMPANLSQPPPPMAAPPPSLARPMLPPASLGAIAPPGPAPMAPAAPAFVPPPPSSPLTNPILNAPIPQMAPTALPPSLQRGTLPTLQAGALSDARFKRRISLREILGV